MHEWGCRSSNTHHNCRRVLNWSYELLISTCSSTNVKPLLILCYVTTQLKSEHNYWMFLQSLLEMINLFKQGWAHINTWICTFVKKHTRICFSPHFLNMLHTTALAKSSLHVSPAEICWRAGFSPFCSFNPKHSQPLAKCLVKQIQLCDEQNPLSLFLTKAASVWAPPWIKAQSWWRVGKACFSRIYTG